MATKEKVETKLSNFGLKIENNILKVERLFTQVRLIVKLVEQVAIIEKVDVTKDNVIITLTRNW